MSKGNTCRSDKPLLPGYFCRIIDAFWPGALTLLSLHRNCFSRETVGRGWRRVCYELLPGFIGLFVKVSTGFFQNLEI